MAASAAAYDVDEETVDFACVLLSRSGAPDLRKTDRTRLKLLAGLVSELQSGVERAGLKVAAVTASAGVAHGTFYRYFDDIRAATEALVEAFAGFVREQLEGAREGEPGSRERVHGATLIYARVFRANAPLMRCLFDLGGDNTAVSRSLQTLNWEWNMRMAASIAKRRAVASGGRPQPPADLLPVAYALGGMIDEFLSQLYLRQDPALEYLTDNEGAVADLLTQLWCLGAYGEVRG
jgi:TetR/AcrR family transcriptional regulator, ethionamide resistance regulator